MGPTTVGRSVVVVVVGPAAMDGRKEGRKMTIVVCLCDPRCREEQ